MVLTRDDMLRELELLPVWRAKYIEQSVNVDTLNVEPVKARVIEAVSEVAPPKTPLAETPVSAIEAEVFVSEPEIASGHATSKVIGDACVASALVSLSQHVEATSVNCLVVSFSPDASTVSMAELFAEEQGELLNNMLAAIQLKFAGDNFSAFGDFNKFQAVQTLLLVIGESAAQSLLASDAPIDELRGRLHVVQGCNVVVTYHPVHLLQYPKDKAKAWQDLLLAKKALADLQS